MKDGQNDYNDENNSSSSESVPDDERMDSVKVPAKKFDTKSDVLLDPKTMLDARDDEPEKSERVKSCTATRLTPTKMPATPESDTSKPKWSTTPTKTYSFTPTKAQREEVDVFKQRLETLQKKRSGRQSERNKQSNKPTVRFGTF
jgi:hypothetical protein